MNRMPEKKTVAFIIKFFMIFAVFHSLLFLVDISFLQELIAGIEAGLLGLPQNGTLVFIGEQAYSIAPSCTGLVSAIILASIIFSLKKPSLRKKIIIFGVGAAALFLINLVRVYFVLLIGMMYGVGAADTVHVISWYLMSGGIIIAWFYLTKKVTGIKSFDGFL